MLLPESHALEKERGNTHTSQHRGFISIMFKDLVNSLEQSSFLSCSVIFPSKTVGLVECIEGV